ncbi:hypothetical protein IAT38_005661 [Cryptococcus sp. DSM 104549]
MPALFSPKYTKRISALYDVKVHPVSAALRLAHMHPDNVLKDRNDRLLRMSIPVNTLHGIERRGQSPWLHWEDEAEEKYAREHDPVCFQAWEDAGIIDAGIRNMRARIRREKAWEDVLMKNRMARIEREKARRIEEEKAHIEREEAFLRYREKREMSLKTGKALCCLGPDGRWRLYGHD